VRNNTYTKHKLGDARMINKRKKVDSQDLLNITRSFIEKTKGIEKKSGNDLLINQGLFLMVTAYFEDSVRELMRIVLVALPEKLPIESTTISRDQICAVADKGHSIIVDNELYFLFKGGVRSKLEKLLKILFNKEYKSIKKISNRNSIIDSELESIIKLEEITLYRNSIIHNGGKVSIEINEKTKYFKPNSKDHIKFNSKLIKSFTNEYLTFFQYLNSEIKNTFISDQQLSIVKKTELLWKNCFSSPMLQFEDYWEIDSEQDLITGIRHPKSESSISSSEKVLLSIWRHQFDDSIKTEGFLLCSIDYHKIYELHKGLDSLKFYYMKEKSRQTNKQTNTLKIRPLSSSQDHTNRKPINNPPPKKMEEQKPVSVRTVGILVAVGAAMIIFSNGL
jgi:hypothetical protein